ncbi:MAG: DUF3048 domain-containing protein [Clostridia bacterium]|nr:DUF3048 domain-containing protein [Clostridia bacterium]
MRKLFALILISALLLSACTAGNVSDPTEEATIPTEEATVEAAEDGTESVEEETYNIFTDERPYAVMIDNDGNSSRPHAGLEDAYLIYEMYVEGKATRLMAIFKGVTVQKIGPVRSSRHYFLDYVFDNDALYSHAGYSPLALEQISSFGVASLNGLSYEPKYYWRERKYKGDYHSLYTSTGNLSKLASTLGYKQTTDTLPFAFSTDASVYEGESAVDITIPYADFYYVKYKYNEETKLYERFINSDYHPTQSGAKLAAGQIIIQFAKSYPLGDGTARIQLETTGSGKGIYIKDGMQVPLTWKKSSRTAKLKFYTKDGKELVLDPTAQTYVQVMPETLNLKIK